MSALRSLAVLLTAVLTLALFATTEATVGADHLSNVGIDLDFDSPTISTPTDQPVVISGAFTSRTTDALHDQVVLLAKNLTTGQHWNGSSWISGFARFDADTTVAARDDGGQPTSIEFTHTLGATGHRLWITAQVRNDRHKFQDLAIQLDNVGAGPTGANDPRPSEGTLVHQIVLSSPTQDATTAEPIVIEGTSTVEIVGISAKDLTTREWWLSRSDGRANLERRLFNLDIAPVPGTSPQLYRFSGTIPATGHRMWISVTTAEFTDGSNLLTDRLAIQLNTTTASTDVPNQQTPTTPGPPPTTTPDLRAGAIRVTSFPDQIFLGGRFRVAGFAGGTPYGQEAPAIVQLFIRDVDANRYWDGTAWSNEFTLIETALSNQGTTASGVEVVAFSTMVPYAPANRIDLRIRTITADRRYSPFTPFRTTPG